MIKPHINVDITHENKDNYVFASLRPDYISCFRNKYSIFRGASTDTDGTKVMLIVTKNIEQIRRFMKTRPPKIYTVSSETFTRIMNKDGRPTEEWVSKIEVPILDRREIKYEEILENAQIFYLQAQYYSLKIYNEFNRNIQQKFSNRREALIYLVDSGQIVYENKIIGINDKWLEAKEISER